MNDSTHPDLFPQRLEITHGDTRWSLPRDAAMVLPGVGKFGEYAEDARQVDLLLYQSREGKVIILLLPNGQQAMFKGADIKGWLQGYRVRMQVEADLAEKADEQQQT